MISNVYPNDDPDTARKKDYNKWKEEGWFVIPKSNNKNKSESQGNIMPYEVRKVQDSMRCLMISIPRRFARWMQVEKGTLVRIHFDSDEHLGNRLIVEKVTIKDDETKK